MSRPLTPPPSVTPEVRARNGGTSAPTGGSVWDIDPVVPVEESAVSPVEPVATVTVPAATEPAAVTEPARPTEPLLGATPTPARPQPKAAEPAVAKRAVAQTPIARQREKARQSIAAAAAGEPTRRRPGNRTILLLVAAIVGIVAASAVAWLVLFSGSDTEAAVPVGTLAERAPAPVTTLAVAPLDVDAAEDDATESESAPDVAQVSASTIASTTPPPTPTTAAPVAVAATASGAGELAPATERAPAAEAAVPETTTAPTTTAAPTTSLATSGPRITIEPRQEPCKFGSDCLVAGFSLVDFDTQPDSFVCEFANGSRYTISLATSSVDYACATGTRGDSITIEINGVRSATAVHD